MKNYKFSVLLTHDLCDIRSPDQIVNTYLKQKIGFFNKVFHRLVGEIPFLEILIPRMCTLRILDLNVFERIEKRFNVSSTYFVFPYINSPDDRDSVISGWSRVLFNGKWISFQKFAANFLAHKDVGLHAACTKEIALKEQKRNVEALIGKEIISCRQHHLCENKEGLLYFADLFKIDSSFGFNEKLDYNLIHTFYVKGMLEIPLTLQDCTLFSSIKMDVIQAKNVISSMYRKAQKENGVVTILWHYPFSQFLDVYAWLIKKAKNMGAFVGSIQEFVDKVH